MGNKQIVLGRKLKGFKGLFTVLFIFTIPLFSQAQVYTTVADGDWSNAGIWLRDGVATLIPPAYNNSTSITVSHNVIVGLASVIVDQTTINAGSLTINSGFSFSVNNGTSTDLNVSGATININGGLVSNFGTPNNTITFDNTTLINNGTFSLTSGTLTLSGTTSFSGTPNTGTDLFNTTVSAGAVVSTAFGITSNGALTVNGAFTSNALVLANNITVSGNGSSFTANANYSVSGTLTITSPGTFSTNSTANGTITGNLAGTGTFTSSALVTFSGVSTISGGGVKTFDDVTVTGSISASTNINIAVTGDLINNGTINFSSGTWTFNGSSNTLSGTPVQTSFFDLTIAQNANITSSIGFTTADDLSVGGTFTTNAPFTIADALVVSGAIPTGNLLANSAFTVTGVMTINGDITASAGFNAQSTLTVSGVGASFTSNNNSFSVGGTMTVSGSGTLTANAGFDAQGNLTVTGAGSTLTANTAPFTVAGNVAVNTSGVFTTNANGTLSGNLGGSSSYTSTALTTFDGVTSITGAGVKTLNDVIVSGSITGTGSLTVNGNLTNNGGSINLTGGTWTLSGTSKLLNGTSPTLTSFFNLTIPQSTSRTSSISFTTTGTFTVGGSFISNATFTANALTVSGAIPIGSLTTNASFSATGAININGSLTSNAGFSAGTGAFNVAVTTGSFTANNTPFSIGGNLTINGFFTANAGADMTLTDLAGNNFIVSATGNFISLATVIFDGVTTMTQSGPRVFTNIRVNSGRSLFGTNNFTVTGNINNNGGTIDLSAGGVLTIDGSSQLGGSPAPVLTRLNAVTINATRSLLILTDVTINGNLIIDGAIAGNDGTTVTFVGLTMSGSGVGIKTFDNIVVSTGTFTPNVDYSITGDIQVTGTMNPGNATTTLSGTTTITGNSSFNNLVITGTLLSASGTTSILGDFTNDGVCNLSSGIVLFNTASTVRQNIRGSEDIQFNILLVSDVVAGTAVDLSNEIDATKVVYLRDSLGFFNTNAIFDSDGLSNDRSFVLLSTGDDPAQDAEIGQLQTGNAVSSGSTNPSNVTVQRFLSTEGGSNSPLFDNGRIYRYLSSPVFDPPVGQLQDDFYVTGTFPGADNGSTPGCTGCSTNPSLYFYNSSIPGYVSFPGGNLSTGVGYAAFIRNDLAPPGGGTPGLPITVDFTGRINAGPVTISSISPDPSVWNLVGNPYPSDITWNNTGTGSTNIAPGIAVRNNGAPGGVLVPLTTGDKIALGQAFWVRALANGAAQLRFNESDKLSGPGAPTTIFYRMKEDISDELSLKVVRNDGIYDETFIKIIPEADLSVDLYDIPKKNGSSDLNNDFVDITSVSADGKSLLLNNVPQIVCGQPINLNFEDQLENGATDLTTASFKLSIKSSGSLKALSWTIHDNFTGSSVNLTPTNFYEFTVNTVPGSSLKDRFYLMASSTPIDVTKSVFAQPTICAGEEATIFVSNAQNKMTYGLEINGTYYPNLAQGGGGNMEIYFDSDLLNTGSNTIRVKVNSGCQEEFLATTINMGKENVFQPTSTTGASSCKSGSVLLSAFGAPANTSYKWYGAISGGSVLGSGQNFNTPIISDTTVYYVAIENSLGCEGERVPVMAAVSDVRGSILVTKSSDIICSGESATLDASVTEMGGSFKWYESLTSVDPLLTGDQFITPELEETQNYFVSYTTPGGCEGDRAEVSVSVSDFKPTLNAVSDKEKVCIGGAHVLMASGAPSGTTYEWFDSMEGSTPIAIGDSFETPLLTSSITYFYLARNEFGCSSNRFSIVATVDTTDPSISIVTDVTKVCQSDNVEIFANGAPAGSSYKWYVNQTDFVPASEGLSATWDDLSYASSYFIAAVNAFGCEGSKKEFVLDVVNFIDARIDSISDGFLTSNYEAGNQWYFEGVPISGAVDNKIFASKTGIYSVKVLVDGFCETWASRFNLSSIVTDLEEELQKGFSVYPNPVNDILEIRVTKSFEDNITLMDNYGRNIATLDLTASGDGKVGNFDVRTLPQGFYYVKAIKSSKPVFIKIIKH